MSTIGAEAISTRRLDLLPLLVGHAEEMASVLSDPALHTFTGGTPDTLQALRSRYQRMTAGSPDPAVLWLNWVIRLRDESCLTGTVQATINPSGHGPVAEIAWVVGTPWQGRGIATEAAQGLVGWLSQQPVTTVIAHIHPGHQASAAIATAAGLTPTDERQVNDLGSPPSPAGSLRSATTSWRRPPLSLPTPSATTKSPPPGGCPSRSRLEPVRRRGPPTVTIRLDAGRTDDS